MHRRPARGQARIAPPSLTSDDKPRLTHRTHRIWLILVCVLCILTFTHYALPPATTAHVNHFPALNLTPKNYLNASHTDPSPFEFCPGPDDKLATKYGAQVLSKIVMHAGSGERVRRVINRALAGQPITISIIGGSVSACHGAGDDPIAPTCYPARFFNWWNSIFPHPATELTNGAMRRTNSGYFGFCSAHHIPDLTDLVIIELDGDDTTDPDMLENFETLVRSILIRPDAPAVLLLGHFNPQTHTIYGFAGPDHAHDIVAQFYDVPHISTKPIHFPPYIRDAHALAKYFVDPVLASPLGHQVLADVLTAYMQSQICSAWSDISSSSPLRSHPPSHPDLFGGVGQRKGVPEPGIAEPDIDADGNRLPPVQVLLDTSPPSPPLQLTPVPPGRISTRPGATFQEIAPFCVSANDLINPLPPSMFYGSGWEVFHAPPTSAAGEHGGLLRTTAHYWFSRYPGSKLRIPIQVGAGDIGVYYIHEGGGAGGEGERGEGSEVECWVDDNVAGARRIANWGEGGGEETRLVVIDHFVSRGSHFVECVLRGEEGRVVRPFRVVGVFAT